MPDIRHRFASKMADMFVAYYETSPWLVSDVREFGGSGPLEYRLRSAAGFGLFENVSISQNDSEHPMLQICEGAIRLLGDEIYRVDHPLERHPERLELFGPWDGTSKIYDRRASAGAALSSGTLPFHHDGLGSAGTVKYFALFCESSSGFGGRTSIANLHASAMALAIADREAFVALFLPDACTAIRSRGSQALAITSPILYCDDFGVPKSFYRETGDEYLVTNAEDPALSRGLQWIRREFVGERFSSVVPTWTPGVGCLVDNFRCVHGRTAFDDTGGSRRVLSRKWWSDRVSATEFKHVPGRYYPKSIVVEFPELADTSNVEGTWRFDEARGTNVRLDDRT